LEKWNRDYFINAVNEIRMPDNIKCDACTPINTADDCLKFGDYLQMVKEGLLELRLSYSIYISTCPGLLNDFFCPEDLMKGFAKNI